MIVSFILVNYLGELTDICGMFEYLGEGDWLFRAIWSKKI